ncbi:MAG: hypothetical protein CMJ78_06890 [Planctomycetaceae bacterium]|nr:hypothetical protein [Planctomycetaceae bacterium]
MLPAVAHQSQLHDLSDALSTLAMATILFGFGLVGRTAVNWQQRAQLRPSRLALDPLKRGIRQT